MMISWDSTGSILRTDIYYTKDSGTSWIPIRKVLVNSGTFAWRIPEFQEKYPDAIFSQEPAMPARVRPLVDGSGSITDILLFEGGLGYDGLLKVEIEEPGFTGTLAEVIATVANGSITGFEVTNGGSGYTPTQQTTIGIKVEDTNNQNVYSIVENILIT